MDLKELELAGNDAASHWYYRAKSEMMLSHLSGLRLNSVMDVCSGSGFFARHPAEHRRRDVICVDNGYEADGPTVQKMLLSDLLIVPIAI